MRMRSPFQSTTWELEHYCSLAKIEHKDLSRARELLNQWDKLLNSSKLASSTTSVPINTETLPRSDISRGAARVSRNGET